MRRRVKVAGRCFYFNLVPPRSSSHRKWQGLPASIKLGFIVHLFFIEGLGPILERGRGLEKVLLVGAFN